MNEQQRERPQTQSAASSPGGNARRTLLAAGALTVVAVVAIVVLLQGFRHPRRVASASDAPIDATVTDPRSVRPATSAGSPSPGPHASFRDCAECPEMVMIPPGSFQMGSPLSDPERGDIEGPVHTVKIGYSLAVGEYPTTRGEWRQYLTQTHRSGSGDCNGFNQAQLSGEQRQEYNWRNTGFAQQDDHPVVCITWQEAQDYAAWLSKRTGHHYRLLSEAEYEYVERAGSQSPYPWGDESDAQCKHTNAADASAYAALHLSGGIVATCSDGFVFTSPVDHFPANAFGLHDTDGNVASWVQDCYHDSYQGAPADGSAWESAACDEHVVRGASWGFYPSWLRAADRVRIVIGGGGNTDVGVRVARAVP